MKNTNRLLGIDNTNINLFLGGLSIEAQNILRIIDRKDPYTAGHCIRVAMIVANICKLLEVDENLTSDIINGAAVHDLGKAAIPDEVLMKAGKLTDMEFLTMKSHSLKGALLLERMGLNETIAEIAHYHHERWIGGGYPDSLAGTEIPLGARITAIADSIDAMSTTRCYRKHLSPEVVYSEIAKNRGIMYDPNIVDIVLPNWETILDGIYTNT